MADLKIEVRLDSYDVSPDTPKLEQMKNITSIHASITQPGTDSDNKIGHIEAHLFNKAAMQSENGPNGMWAECEAYDDVFGPAVKLAKIENYLSN